MSQPIKFSIPTHPKFLDFIRKVLQEPLNYHEVPDEIARGKILYVGEEPAPILSNTCMESFARYPLRQDSISMTMISKCR